MDEVHYLADRMRGAVWEEVIIHLPESVRLVSLSATVSNAEEFGAWIATVRGSTEVIVSEQSADASINAAAKNPVLGRTYARAGKYEQAAEAFRRGLDAAPGDVELSAAANYWLSRSFVRCRQPAQAALAFEVVE